MVSFVRACSLFGLAALVVAGPVAVRTTDLEVYSSLDERGIPSIQLGSYSLATSHVNDVLFNVGFGSTSGRVGDAFHLKVACIDCRTWGNAVISTAGVNKKVDVIGDIISFFKDPVDAVVEAFDLNIKIALDNVGGHFDFNILAANTGSYSFPIFMSQTPSGFAVSEDVSFGLVLSIDLVFSLTAVIDLDAGFEFAFPAGAYITVDPISGHIVDQAFIGGEINNLPIIVHSGSATFKAALRVRVQAGTTVELFGTGFDFELGVFADLVEYVATIGTSDQCELFITESVDLNIGAYAHAVVEVDYKTFGASPAIVTTLLEYPLPSLCLTRPIQTSLPAVPTPEPILVITSGATDITTSAAAIPTSLLLPTASPSSQGGVFLEGSSSTVTSTTLAPVPSSSASYGYGNNTLLANITITSAASLTTSTVYATDIITITACPDTVLHCPASLTSDIVITSTKVLYTTICPVGAILPTSLPSASPTSVASSLTTSKSVAIAAVSSTAIHIVSPLPLTPLATPILETIYTPTFVNPTYIMPTATVFTVAHPDWNATVPTAVSLPIHAASVPAASTTVGGVFAPLPSSGTNTALGLANSTLPVVATGLPKPATPTEFTGAASRNVGAGLMIGFGAWMLILL